MELFHFHFGCSDCIKIICTKMKKKLSVAVAGVFAVIYLLNPTAGFIELIPDAFPIIGNLDEAGAVLIIVAALRHFGIDLNNLFDAKDIKSEKKKETDKTVIQIQPKN